MPALSVTDHKDDLFAVSLFVLSLCFLSSPPLLMSAENYTLFIKNSVTFPQFEVVR